MIPLPETPSPSSLSNELWKRLRLGPGMRVPPFREGKHRVRLYAGRRSGRKPGPTLGGLLAERQKEEKIAPVWPCEPLCALFPERAAAMRTPTLLERVWASFWEFAEDERKSRRKNRRFCCAGSHTTARSAGSCGVLKGRCSGHEIVALTPFSVDFGCLLRAAKSLWGVPGLLRHECPPQELRC